MPYADTHKTRKRSKIQQASRDEVNEQDRKRRWYIENREREQEKARRRNKVREILSLPLLWIHKGTPCGGAAEKISVLQIPSFVTKIRRDTKNLRHYFSLMERSWAADLIMMNDLSAKQRDQIFYRDEDGFLCTRNIVEQIAWIDEKTNNKQQGKEPYSVVHQMAYIHQPQWMTAEDLEALEERVRKAPLPKEVKRTRRHKRATPEEIASARKDLASGMPAAQVAKKHNRTRTWVYTLQR